MSSPEKHARLPPSARTPPKAPPKKKMLRSAVKKTTSDDSVVESGKDTVEGSGDTNNNEPIQTEKSEDGLVDKGKEAEDLGDTGHNEVVPTQKSEDGDDGKAAESKDDDMQEDGASIHAQETVSSHGPPDCEAGLEGREDSGLKLNETVRL